MRKILSFLLTLTLVLGLFSGLALSAAAEDSGTDGQEQAFLAPVEDVPWIVAENEEPGAVKVTEVRDNDDPLPPQAIREAPADEGEEEPVLYAITVAETDHAEVKVKPESAQEDDEVEILVTPEEGYHVDSIEVVCGDIWYPYVERVEEFVGNAQCYKFTMCEGDAVVTVTMKSDKHIHTDADFGTETVFEPLPEGFAGGTLASGNYVLEQDIVLTSDLVVEQGAQVILCMNNYHIDLGRHHIVINGLLYLLDCEDNQDSRFYTRFEQAEDGSWAYGNEAAENTVAMVGSVIFNGYAEQGGAVYNEGTLYMEKVSIFGCAAVTGGAIYQKGTALLEDDAVIEHCTAKNAGGIYSIGSTILLNCSVLANTAEELAGGVEVIASENWLDGLTLCGYTAISANKAAGADSNVYLHDGVKIYLMEDEYAPALGGAREMYVGITTETLPTDDAPVEVTASSDANYLKAFVSDNWDYTLRNVADGEDNVIELTAHKHAWVYTAEDNKLIATCDDAESHADPATETVTLYEPFGVSYGGYTGEPMEAYFAGDTFKDKNYYLGDYALTLDMITYEEKDGEGWKAMEGAPILPGDYRAILKVDDAQAVLEFTVPKASRYITYVYTPDFGPDDELKFNVISSDGSEVLYAYGKSEEGPFDDWDKVYDGPGTYYVRFYIPEDDLGLEAELIEEFTVYTCAYWEDQEISETSDWMSGFLTLGGVEQDGVFQIEYVEGEGYSIELLGEGYLAPAGEKIADAPFYWQYDGGFYFETPAAEEGGDPVKNYLTDNFTTSTEKVEAKIGSRVLSTDHEPGENWVDLGNGYHGHVCENCGKVVDKEEHKYADAKANACSECGALREKPPLTGDESPVRGGLYLILLALAVTGAGLCVSIVGKKNGAR